MSKVPKDSPARAASARAIWAENIIADRRGIISCVLPSIAAMPSGREAASPRPSDPNCSDKAADRARDTFKATGSQMRFHVGIVCSTHATLLHTSRVTGPEAKSVAVGAGSPLAYAACFAPSSTKRQLTGPAVVFMRNWNWPIAARMRAGSENSGGRIAGSKP